MQTTFQRLDLTWLVKSPKDDPPTFWEGADWFDVGWRNRHQFQVSYPKEPDLPLIDLNKTFGNKVIPKQPQREKSQAADNAKKPTDDVNGDTKPEPKPAPGTGATEEDLPKNDFTDELRENDFTDDNPDDDRNNGIDEEDKRDDEQETMNRVELTEAVQEVQHFNNMATDQIRKIMEQLMSQQEVMDDVTGRFQDNMSNKVNKKRKREEIEDKRRALRRKFKELDDEELGMTDEA
ncbi:hypothetical protein B0T24DRAFT_682649 [Lasiosphaeria ovina]|uniref:Uncharacterized protein n=1 Tax=Lasiosphaeria ovina TaxID=92902 RepID=A0AAE0JWE7_9PEZI|nr:hypothetical protein B0T24DRAFT_682649 [Lasiosphaeria ovina]